MLVCAAVLLFSQAAVAQTVNVESLAKDKPGFALQLAGSVALSSGNVNQTRARAGLHTQYQSVYEDPDPDDNVPAFLRQRGLLISSIGYQSVSDERVNNDRFAHARWTAMWLRRLGSELFAQYQFAEFARLQARILAGAGGRVVLLYFDEVEVTFASAYMFEFEQLTTPDGEAKPDATIAHRWTNLLSASLDLFDGGLTLTNIAYIQPRFDEFSDYRALNELSLDVAVTKVLSLGSALTVAHDSEPPAGVEPTDTRFVQTLKLTF